MNKFYLYVAILLLIGMLTGCKVSLEQGNPTTQPENTTIPVQVTTLPQQEEPTVNPFENESEIDFSEFETIPDVTEPVQTEPEATKPQVKPEPTQPEETQPRPTQPEVTEPENTEPEETAPSESLPPEYEPDGYNSQIVRP